MSVITGYMAACCVSGLGFYLALLLHILYQGWSSGHGGIHASFGEFVLSMFFIPFSIGLGSILFALPGFVVLRSALAFLGRYDLASFGLAGALDALSAHWCVDYLLAGSEPALVKGVSGSVGVFLLIGTLAGVAAWWGEKRSRAWDSPVRPSLPGRELNR